VYQIAKNGEAEWLVEYGRGAEKSRFAMHLRAAKGRDEHDGQRGMRSTNRCEHPKSRGAGHLDIGDEQVRRTILRRTQSLE